MTTDIKHANNSSFTQIPVVFVNVAFTQPCFFRTCVNHKSIVSYSPMARDQKIRCREIAAYALKVGWIKKPSVCQGCAKPGRLVMHHERYDLPMEIVWLCTKCHDKIEGAKRRRSSSRC